MNIDEKSFNTSNPDERDKCLSQIIFLQKNKKIICKALIIFWTLLSS